MEMIFFRVSGQAYGMRIDFLEGVENLSGMTPVAQAPANVMGVTNIRGEVVPVYDLAGRFGIKTVSDTNKYLFVRIGGEPLCIQVDSVDGMGEYSKDEILKMPSIIACEGTRYISNVVRMKTTGELALVIMPDKLIRGIEQQSIVDFVSGM